MPTFYEMLGLLTRPASAATLPDAAEAAADAALEDEPPARTAVSPFVMVDKTH